MKLASALGQILLGFKDHSSEDQSSEDQSSEDKSSEEEIASEVQYTG